MFSHRAISVRAPAMRALHVGQAQRPVGHVHDARARPPDAPAHGPRTRFDTYAQQQPSSRAPRLARPGRVLRLGTLNTRTLNHAGDAEQLALDLSKAGVHICGLQEVRRRGMGNVALAEPAGGWRLVWSGQSGGKRDHGVGALLSPMAAAALRGTTPISERLLALHFRGTVDVTVLVAYSPTNTTPNATMSDAFYQLLSTTLDSIPKHHMCMVLGDMNAQVGCDKVGWAGIIGGFGAPRSRLPPWLDAALRAEGTRAANAPMLPQPSAPAPNTSPLSAISGATTASAPPSVILSAAPTSSGRSNRARGQRWAGPWAANNNGRRCLELCASHGLFVANTYFQHRDVHTASFVSNTKRYWATLDLFLVSQRFRSSVLDTRVLPSATAHSTDHRLVVCDIALRLQRPNAPVAAKPPRFKTVPHDSPAQKEFASALATTLQTHSALSPQLGGSDSEQQAMVKAVTTAATQHLGHAPRVQRRRPWLTDETLQLAQAKRAAYSEWATLRDSHVWVPNPTATQVVEMAAVAAQMAEKLEAYHTLNKQVRAAARRDRNDMLQAQARAMDALMQQGRTHAAFQIADELRGKQRGGGIPSVITPEGVVSGEGVAEALARHFQATLNVPTQVAPQLLASIPTAPTTATTPLSEVAAAAMAAGTPPLVGPPQPAPASRATRASTARAAAHSSATAAAADLRAAAQEQALNELPPTVEEVREALGAMRNTSSPGADGLGAGLLKLGDSALLSWLHRVIKAAWTTGTAPTAWKQVQMVALPKSGAPKLDNFRGITLIDVCGKVYVTIIHHRIRALLNSQLMDAQFGFRPGRGTNGAQNCLTTLVDMSVGHGVPLHAAFVDFRKAFDSVNREALWTVLAARGVGPKLLALIRDLYSGCEARVLANGQTSSWFPMSTGVRQGCPMSPTLFNVFIDFLARLVTARCHAQGIRGYRFAYRIGGRLVQPATHSDDIAHTLMLLYADDLVLFAHDAASLREALLVLERTAMEWGMQLNYAKTVVVQFGSEPQPGGQGPDNQEDGARPAAAPPTSTQLAHGLVTHADHFKYLGSIVEASGSRERELSRRLQLAGAAFHQLHARVFASREVSLGTKLTIYNAVVVPTLMYGAAATWALTGRQLQRASAFHNNCLRRLLRAQRRHPNMISNQELYATTQQPPLEALLVKHRLRLVGHAARMGDATAAKQLLFNTGPRPPTTLAVPQPQEQRQLQGGSGSGPVAGGVAGPGNSADVVFGSDRHERVGRGYSRFLRSRLLGGPKATWKRVAAKDVALAMPGQDQNWLVTAMNKVAWRDLCQTAASRVQPR